MIKKELFRSPWVYGSSDSSEPGVHEKKTDNLKAVNIIQQQLTASSRELNASRTGLNRISCNILIIDCNSLSIAAIKYYN